MPLRTRVLPFVQAPTCKEPLGNAGVYTSPLSVGKKGPLKYIEGAGPCQRQHITPQNNSYFMFAYSFLQGHSPNNKLQSVPPKLFVA